MDISRFYPGAFLDEPKKATENNREQTVQSQGSSGLNQNMLMSLLPMLMGGGGDISSVLGNLAGGGNSSDAQMINTLTTMLKNKSDSGNNSHPQKQPQQYVEADDYIFD